MVAIVPSKIGTDTPIFETVTNNAELSERFCF